MIEPISLLILDFDGVCVRGLGEAVSSDSYATDDASVARPEMSLLVATARERGTVTVILSNEINTSWSTEFPILERVDHVVNCADNGILKPDRRAFQRCLLLTGKNAESALVVDDDPDNVNVAESLGMRSILFDRMNPQASIAEISMVLE